MLPKKIEKGLGLKRRSKDDPLRKDLKNLFDAIDGFKRAVKEGAIEDFNRLKKLVKWLFGKKQ